MTETESRCTCCRSPLETGYACHRCEQRIARDLDAILDAYAIADEALLPGKGGEGRSTERSLGVRIEALDLLAGNLVLDVLESWERYLRAEYGLSPYGPASSVRTAEGIRASLDADSGLYGAPRSTVDVVSITLTGTIRFLKTYLEEACRTFEPIADLAEEVRDLRNRAEHAAGITHRKSWRVDCPTTLDDGTACGNRLRVSGENLEGVTYCRACRTEWPVERLLLVAASDADSAIWVDAEALANRLGVSEKTLTRWAKDGKIAKKGQLYDYRSFRELLA